jgi:hypothetical protein
VTDFKLGKKLGVVKDPRTISAHRLLTTSKAPPEHRVAHNLRTVPVFANDTYGDCTFASQGHRIEAQENSSRQREIELTDADVIDGYSAVTGFQPDDPSTDNGAYELDVLNYMRKVGIGREKDGSRHTIGAFAAVDWRSYMNFKIAHYVFGGLKVCAGLPIAAQSQKVWDVTSGLDGEPGSWGGHSMYCVGYDDQGITVYTWGREKRATWAWVDTYVDECYAVISEDYFRRGGLTPQGFSLEKLTRQLEDIDRRRSPA